MATRMGGAEVEVKLDTTKAEKTITDLENRLKAMQRKAAELGKSLGAGKASVSGVTSQQVTGTSGGSGEKNVANEVVRNVKKMGGGKFATAALTASVSGIPGRVAGSVESSMPGTLKVAGAAALGYAAASTAAKVSPLALEAVRAALPEALANSAFAKFVEGALEDLRNGFTTLESGVKSIFTGGAKTADLAAASLRVTGQMPNLAYYYDQNVKSDTQESRLEKKFSEYKQKEVAAGVGKALGDLMRGSFSR